MIANGWAAFFPVYGSLPKDLAMNMAIAAAELAWDNKAGAWAFAGDDVLLAYEYRLCIKLGMPGPQLVHFHPGDDPVSGQLDQQCNELAARWSLALRFRQRHSTPFVVHPEIPILLAPSCAPPRNTRAR